MRIARNITLLSFIFLMACKGNDPDVLNPYDNQVVEQGDDIVKIDDKDIDPNTIQGLHKNIFAPTCANSGCHDGNFEPDFRTIESSYNTMVNQPIIKDDLMNPLTYRVTPGNSETSMLVRRLKVDINGNSGTMPIVTEPGSDWHDKKAEYIANIENWINNGALNQQGDSSSSFNIPVQLIGVSATVSGQLALRGGFYNPIPIPPGTSNIELWFAYEDDNLSSGQLSGAKVNWSFEANTFDSMNWVPLQYVPTPLTAVGYFGEDVAHHFKAVINTSTYLKNDVLWFRSTISDGVNASELPNDNSIFRAKQYTAIKMQ